MFRHYSRTILLAGLPLLVSATVFGQDFRMYTAVYDESAATNQRRSEKPEPVSSSLTLFHAGKVYDYISSIGEVTIYEPAHNRFTVLNTSRRMSATVDVDEINHKLRVAEDEVRNRISELIQQDGSDNSSLREVLKFQLKPEFEETYDAQRKRLTLKSPHMLYEVRCADPETQSAIDPEAVEVYLRFADWVKKLNYVLHPRPILPYPRLSLNDSLRRRKLLPTQVELQADIGTKLHLKAEHQIHWNLSDSDRSLIEGWETMLHDKETRQVPIRRYQETILVSRAKKKR